MGFVLAFVSYFTMQVQAVDAQVNLRICTNLPDHQLFIGVINTKNYCSSIILCGIMIPPCAYQKYNKKTHQEQSVYFIRLLVEGGIMIRIILYSVSESVFNFLQYFTTCQRT